MRHYTSFLPAIEQTLGGRVVLLDSRLAPDTQQNARTILNFVVRAAYRDFERSPPHAEQRFPIKTHSTEMGLNIRICPRDVVPEVPATQLPETSVTPRNRVIGLAPACGQ